MTYSYYDRLTALDTLFLEIEDANVHMHVGSVGIFDAGPLQTVGGGLDMERIRSMTEPALMRSRRFRQRLATIPVFDHPVWVDDQRFNIDYHVRHAALPHPGDERQLKRMVGRIMSQKLDREKPLWELWFVEGCEDDRFAVISKLHHCMIDGVSGVDLMAALMGPDPDHELTRSWEATSHRWLPRPAPGAVRLLADEVRRRAALPLEVLRGGREALIRPRRSFENVSNALGSLREALGAGLQSASSTPLNPETIGPHRRFDWARFDLGAVKEVKNRLGGTLNDVVLATVAGGMRAFLEGRGVRVDELEFRAQVPVNVRTGSQRGKLGNRVVMLLPRLPVDEPDPRERMKRVVETTRELKQSHQVEGGQLLEELGDWTGKDLLSGFVRLAARGTAFNIVVTNIPGPQVPIYLLGARMQEVYPLVPLFTNQAVGIALFSYDGSLFWGFNADWESVPDLHDLVLALETEFEALRKL